MIVTNNLPNDSYAYSLLSWRRNIVLIFTKKMVTGENRRTLVLSAAHSFVIDGTGSLLGGWDRKEGAKWTDGDGNCGKRLWKAGRPATDRKKTRFLPLILISIFSFFCFYYFFIFFLVLFQEVFRDCGKLTPSVFLWMNCLSAIVALSFLSFLRVSILFLTCLWFQCWNFADIVNIL